MEYYGVLYLHSTKCLLSFYQRSCWRTRSRGRRRRRTCGLLLSQWEHGSPSPHVCRPSQSRRTSPTSGAQRCRPSQLESSKQRVTCSWPWNDFSTPRCQIFQFKLVVFINFLFPSFKSTFFKIVIFFRRTSRFASFPEYLVLQIKKFTFGVDWVPKKLGNCLLPFTDKWDFKCLWNTGLPSCCI